MMHRFIRSRHALPVLLSLLPLLAAASPPPASGGPSTLHPPPSTVPPASPPSGVSSSWLTRVQSDIRTSEYNITWTSNTVLKDVAGAYQAPNRKCNLRTYFTPEGVRMVRRTESAPTWEVGMRIAECGTRNGDAEGNAQRSTFNVQLPTPERAELVVQGNRAEYRRGLVTEWYVNDERGLEQGFTIQKSEVGSQESAEAGSLPSTLHPPPSTFLLDLALTGNCTARQNGDAIHLVSPSGETVLQYGQMKAVDAMGKELACRMELVATPTGSKNPAEGEALGLGGQAICCSSPPSRGVAPGSGLAPRWGV